MKGQFEIGPFFLYYCLTASYRVPLTFSWAGLESAAEGLHRLRENVRRLNDEIERNHL